MSEIELEIERHGKNAVVSSPMAVFSFQVTDEDPRTWNQDRGSSGFNYSVGATQMVIGDVEVLPYGSNNDMPQLLRDTVYTNPSVPSAFEQKQGLLWGQGPHLYEEDFEGNELVRKWKTDKEIMDFLESWDYQDYLLSVITDFNFVQASATRFVRSKGSLIGKKGFFSKLEHLNPMWTRLAKKGRSEKATHVIYSQYWERNSYSDYKLYKMFDPADPFAVPNSVMYAKKMTFATEHYPIPTIFGALEWIRRSTAVPLILRALSKNSMNANYHVTSPAKFWDLKKEEIEKDCLAKGIDYDDSMLQDYEKLLFQTIVKTLTSDENVGKIWHTKNMMVADGMNLMEQGWTITAIDQNIKDFIDTQIKVGNKADASVVSSLNIHKSLAGISGEGKSDSGSEQLYAYLMYKLIGVNIPEYVVMKPLNALLRANFPNSKLKMGFKHGEAQKQEDQSSKDRVKNQPV